MLAMQPNAVLFRSLEYPKDADKAFEPTVEEAGKLWEEAEGITKDTKGYRIYTEDLKDFQKEISDKLEIIKEAEEIGGDYAQWCTTLDEYMKLARGATNDEAIVFFGRGKALNLSLIHI